MTLGGNMLKKIFALIVFISFVSSCGGGGGSGSDDDLDDSSLGKQGRPIGELDTNGDGVADGIAIDVDGDGEGDGLDTDKDNVIDKGWSDSYVVLPFKYRVKKKMYYGNKKRSNLDIDSSNVTFYKIENYYTDKSTSTDYNIGDDGIAFTSDDYITGKYTMNFSSDGKKATGIYYWNGNDGIFGNSDDQFSDIWKYDFAVSKDRCTRQIGYSAGADNLPFTSDDTIVRILRNEYDSKGRLILSIVYSSPGDDGDWFTYSDNSVNPNEDIPYDYHWAPWTYFPYYGRGNRYIKIDYPDGNERRAIWNAGIDNIPLTGDDYVQSYDLYITKCGMLSKAYYYNAKGSDGKWFTSDDVLNVYEENITDSDSAYKPERLQTYRSEEYIEGAWVKATRFRVEAYTVSGQIKAFGCGFLTDGKFDPYTDGFGGWEQLNYLYEYEKY